MLRHSEAEVKALRDQVAAAQAAALSKQSEINKLTDEIQVCATQCDLCIECNTPLSFQLSKTPTIVHVRVFLCSS